MANETLESLEIEVKHSATGAAEEITKVARAVYVLHESLKGIVPKMRKLAESMNLVGKDSPLTINNNTMQQYGSTINNVVQSASKAKTAATDTAKGIGKVSEAASKASTPLSNFVSSLKRIAFYRFIRSIIKAITQAFQEGLQAAYTFSSGIDGQGHRFAEALDRMKTAGNQMKGQLGSAFISLLAAIEPILIKIINLIIQVADALSQLFAAFTGRTYLKANKVPSQWADTMERGAGAAKEWKNQLLGFDEINRLNEPSGGGGGGGSNPLNGFDFTDTPLDAWAQKLRDLIEKLEFNIKDVLFNWDDLNPENIAKKAIVGLSGLLGAGVGFLIGGVPGAVIGTILGVTIGLLIDSLIFDNDGQLSEAEIADMIRLALVAITGGIIGFAVGGVPGALIGATIGVGLFAAIKTIDFFGEGGGADLFLDKLVAAMTVFAGAVIGFAVGGPAGALIGATIGLGVAAIVTAITFDNQDPKKSQYKSAWAYFVCGILGLPTDQEVEEGAKKLWDSFVQGLKQGIEDTGTMFFGNYWYDIIDYVKGIFGIHSPSTVFQDIGMNVVQGFWNGIQEKWNEFTGFFEGLWQKFQEWWGNLSLPAIHIPHPSFTWTYSEATGLLARAMEFAGLNPVIPHLNISWYAQGGFPDEGSLFFAGERGAELVGTMGGRTAVANNQEITDGIRQAVYDAMMASNANGNSNVDVRVFLDSREIKTGQQRLNKSMGVA